MCCYISCLWGLPWKTNVPWEHFNSKPNHWDVSCWNPCISIGTHFPSHGYATDDGKIWVLICTVAFGMGINCKSVWRVIHFGPSKSVELYIQEFGRAVRDSLQSTCILLYNGLLSANCENDMKQYVQIQQCCRKWLMEHFGCQSNHVNYNTHKCCDICSSWCTCESDDCGVFWRPCQDGDQLPEPQLSACDGQRNPITRIVNKHQKE